MKTRSAINSAAVTLALILGWSFQGTAQTVQYVTVICTNDAVGNNLPLQTNQVVSLVGCPSNAICYWVFQNGSQIADSSVGHAFSGLTNVIVWLNGSGNNNFPTAATYQITTPASATIVSNYVPADAIVIPASATGNVQIILESSPDLVNWTAAEPGIYGASAGTNRFFRVRAVVN